MWTILFVSVIAGWLLFDLSHGLTPAQSVRDVANVFTQDILKPATNATISPLLNAGLIMFAATGVIGIILWQTEKKIDPTDKSVHAPSISGPKAPTLGGGTSIEAEGVKTGATFS